LALFGWFGLFAIKDPCKMTQTLYAHMNKEKIKKNLKKGPMYCSLQEKSFNSIAMEGLTHLEYV
jgi:hypothetical protein